MEQIAFSFAANNSYQLNEFIESDSNKMAFYTVNNWKDVWGVNPYSNLLIIQGPSCSGKSFLTKIWSNKVNADFLSKNHISADITLDKKHYVIEDFEYWQERKILHIFNILVENRCYGLLTCKSFDRIILPDLLSRLRSLHVIKIHPPDDKMMKMLIFKLFSNQSIVIDNKVIDFLVKILPREFSIIVHSIQQINHYALTHKSRVTIPIVKRVMQLY